MALAAVTMACNGQAKGKQMDQPQTVIDAMIERVQATGTIDVRSVEQVSGTTLRETHDSNASFAFYAAQGVTAGGATIGIDLRTPIAGSGATGGALLVFNVEQGCPHRTDIEARYGPLTIAQVPRGRSPNEQAQWSRREAWGELSFGFAADRPDCLKSVVFAVSGGR